MTKDNGGRRGRPSANDNSGQATRLYCKYCGSYSHDGSCKWPTASIYGLIDPRNGCVFYVGRTVHRIEIRLSNHISIAKNAKRFSDQQADSVKNQWINNLLEVGLRPTVKLLETVSIFNLDAEAIWVNRVFQETRNITNTAPPRGYRGRRSQRKNVKSRFRRA